MGLITYTFYNSVPGISFPVTSHHTHNKVCKPKGSSHHFVHILLQGSLALSHHSRIPQLETNESVFHALCRSCYCKQSHHSFPIFCHKQLQNGRQKV